MQEGAGGIPGGTWLSLGTPSTACPQRVPQPDPGASRVPSHAGSGSGESLGTDLVLSFVSPAPPHSCCTLPVQTPAALVLPSSFSLKEKSLKDLSSLNPTEALLGFGMSLPSPGSDRAFDVSV